MRGRASISVAPGVGDADLPDLVLSHHLARALELPRADLAVRVGAARPNGKPVVQVSAPGGRVVAYAKVGWNDLTRGLVAAEADGAARAGRVAAGGVRARPEVAARRRLGRDWPSRAVVPAIGGRPHVSPEPPPEATRELALGAAVERGPLAESAWWQALLGPDRRRRRRGAARRRGADRGSLRRPGRSRSGAATATGRPGTWPRSEGRLVVWDWERAAPAPGRHRRRPLLPARRPERARAARRDEAVADTHRAGAARARRARRSPSADARLVVALELLEMSVRFAEARAAGVTGLRDRFGVPLAALLEGRYDGGEAS